MDGKLTGLKSWRYVGKRYLIQTPDGARIEMHAVEVEHWNGTCEAVYCATEGLAKAIAALPELLTACEASDLFITRMHEAQCGAVVPSGVFNDMLDDLQDKTEMAIAHSRGYLLPLFGQQEKTK